MIVIPIRHKQPNILKSYNVTLSGRNLYYTIGYIVTDCKIIFTEQGSSSVCTSDTYAGPSAFSEVETASLSAYIRTIASELVGYIDFHSYSQLLMVPYGHTTDKLDNYSEAVSVYFITFTNEFC